MSEESRAAAREWQQERLREGGDDSERAGAETIGGRRLDGRYYHPDGTPKTMRERFGPNTFWGLPVIKIDEEEIKVNSVALVGEVFEDLTVPPDVRSFLPAGLQEIAGHINDQIDPGFSDPDKERERISGIIDELLA